MSAAHDKPIQSKVSVRQHPLHPMVVVYPIAFLTSTVATDAVFWWRGDSFWAEASFWLASAGFVSGVVAALLGLADFVQLRQARAHIAGWSHMTVAITALALAGVNVQLRIGDAAGAVLPWGIAVSTLLAVLVALTGWLGGTLTFRFGIGTYERDVD